MTRIVVDPVVPQWLIAILTGLAVLGIWLSYRRCTLTPKQTAILVGLRLSAVAILAALLFQPQLITVRQKAEPPNLAIVVDTSASMLDSPNRDGEARKRMAEAFLKSKSFRRNAGKYRLLWFELGAGLGEIADPAKEELEFNAPRTHILEGLNELAGRVRGANLAGVILLSDGLDQSSAELTPEARRHPVFVPELEKYEKVEKTAPADTFIAEVNHPKMLVVHWKGQVDVLLKRTHGEGKSVTPVHLYRGNERIRQAYATFEPGQMARQVSFGVEPLEVGQITYKVLIEPPEDTVKENNERLFVIDVTDPKNRILYLEGTPRWEFKFLKRALLREKNYQVSAFVQHGSGVFINFSEASESAELGGLPELADAQTILFRSIILGEMRADALTQKQQEALARYVDKGGGLLFIGSKTAYGKDGWGSSETLRKLLPFKSDEKARVVDGHFAVVPTDLGRSHPVLAQLGAGLVFPDVLSLWGPVEKRASAVPIIEAADGSPLLLVNRYGSGKVAAILTDSLWRWRLGSAPLDGGKNLYEQFVSQLVYWLAPVEKQVDEDANLQVITASGEAEVRDVVAVGAVMGEQAGVNNQMKLTCTVETPDQRTFHLTMGAAKLGAELGLSRPVWGWRAEFVPHTPGEYRLRVQEEASNESAQAKVLVIEPQLEKTRQPLNRAFLKDLARQTGGQFVPLAEAKLLMEAVPFKPMETKMTDERPIWNRPWILILLLALFCAEWYFRGKLDLV